jgi:hypothetical protein
MDIRDMICPKFFTPQPDRSRFHVIMLLRVTVLCMFLISAVSEASEHDIYSLVETKASVGITDDNGLLLASKEWLNPSDWEIPAEISVDQEVDEEMDTRDWHGLKEDAKYFLIYQVFIIGLLYIVPEDISGWTEENKDEGIKFEKYKENIQHLVWDSDKAYINYILHPYWGGTYYVRARLRGFDERESFWFAFMLSTFYEYGAEAIFEKPSMQDMIFTPVGGAFFGEYMLKVRKRVELRNADVDVMSFKDKFLMVMTDPLGALNRTLGKRLGHDAYMDFRPYVREQRNYTSSGGAGLVASREAVIGLNMSLRW